MLHLRWTLGIITAVAAGAWVALVIVGGNFRRSFGASDNSPWMIALPAVVAALVLATLARPDLRPLLHIVAALMALVVVGSLVLARESVFTATMGLLYAGAWLWFYYCVLRG